MNKDFLTEEDTSAEKSPFPNRDNGAADPDTGRVDSRDAHAAERGAAGNRLRAAHRVQHR